jgi:type IV secretory pathway VirB2 component (pilin)
VKSTLSLPTPAFFSRENTKLVMLMLAVLCVFLLLPNAAHAAEGTGGGLPYEGWLTNLRNSITGPFAFTVAVIGIVVAGAVLIFGGELNGFVRTLVFIILVMSLIVGVNNLMSGLFGRGAEIAQAVEATKVALAHVVVRA